MKTRAVILLAAIASLSSGGCLSTAENKAEESPPLSPKVIKWAENGDVEAQCKIGWWYFDHTNYTEAAKWLQRAADAGNHNSLGAAAELFIEGKGIPKDVERGIRYLRSGAEFPDVGGNEECASRLAVENWCRAMMRRLTIFLG
jgi:TPR repeat protein